MKTNILCCLGLTSAIARAPGPFPHLTCFQVWHREWACSRDIPSGAKIQIRNLGRKRARALDTSGEERKEEEEGEEEEE